MSKPELRRILRERLKDSINYLNSSLAGDDLEELKPILERIGRGGKLPHWYELLRTGSMPNLDGKTVGSIIEMTYVAVLEKYIFNDMDMTFFVNPARGVDIPQLDLGIKSPSENYCTSEPFFSAYERILGNEYDALVLLTDYQDSKKEIGAKIQIKKSTYLYGSEIADEYICGISKTIRHRFEVQQDTADAKRLIRFVAYANQSDWLCKELMNVVSVYGMTDGKIDQVVTKSLAIHQIDSRERQKKGKEVIPADYKEVLLNIQSSNQKSDIIVKESDSWVIDNWGDSARLPSDNEWTRFLSSNLNGKIGMSFALQWRYNFGKIFKEKD